MSAAGGQGGGAASGRPHSLFEAASSRFSAATYACKSVRISSRGGAAPIPSGVRSRGEEPAAKRRAKSVGAKSPSARGGLRRFCGLLRPTTSAPRLPDDEADAAGTPRFALQTTHFSGHDLGSPRSEMTSVSFQEATQELQERPSGKGVTLSPRL